MRHWLETHTPSFTNMDMSITIDKMPENMLELGRNVFARPIHVRSVSKIDNVSHMNYESSLYGQSMTVSVTGPDQFNKPVISINLKEIGCQGPNQ